MQQLVHKSDIVFVVEKRWNLTLIDLYALTAIRYGINMLIYHTKKNSVTIVEKNAKPLMRNQYVTSVLKAILGIIE